MVTRPATFSLAAVDDAGKSSSTKTRRLDPLPISSTLISIKPESDRILPQWGRLENDHQDVPGTTEPTVGGERIRETVQRLLQLGPLNACEDMVQFVQLASRGDLTGSTGYQ